MSEALAWEEAHDKSEYMISIPMHVVSTVNSKICQIDRSWKEDSLFFVLVLC